MTFWIGFRLVLAGWLLRSLCAIDQSRNGWFGGAVLLMVIVGLLIYSVMP